MTRARTTIAPGICVAALLAWSCGGGPTPKPPEGPSYVGTSFSLARTTPAGEPGFRDILDVYASSGSTWYGLGADWHELQPSVGQITLDRLLYPLGIVVSDYPQFRAFGLTVTMLNGSRRSLPAELVGRPWDDADVIATFKTLIDAITMEPMINEKVNYIFLGNEIFGGLPTPADVDAFERFYAAIVRHIHVRLPRVQVGTIVSAAVALVGGRTQFDRMLRLSDVAAFTYYPVVGMMEPTPITGPWQLLPSARIVADLTALMDRAGGKPVIINEIGVSSAAINGSSLTRQAQIVDVVFGAFDTRRPAAINWHSLYDYSPALCRELVTGHKIEDPQTVCGYVENLGLRSYATGEAKPAWDRFVAWAKRWRER